MVCKVGNNCGQTCISHCALNTGYSLAKFLAETETVESSIGELIKASDKRGDYLLVTGIQVDSGYNPTKILGPHQMGISRSKKLGNSWNIPTASIVRDYCKIVGNKQETTLNQTLSGIESHKLLLTPLKPGMQCEVYVEEKQTDGGEPILRKKHSTIEYLKWQTNPSTKQVECFVITDVLDAVTNKRGKIPITQYGERILLTDLERSLSVNTDKAHNLIKMTNFGAIHPIEITTGKGNSLVLDNTYLYSVTFDTAIVVASWENGKLVGDKDFQRISKNSLFKLINSYIPYISQHRKYMTPYGVIDSNIINQSELMEASK